MGRSQLVSWIAGIPRAELNCPDGAIEAPWGNSPLLEWGRSVECAGASM